MVILSNIFELNNKANYEKQRHQHPIPGFGSLRADGKLALQPQHYPTVNQLHILAGIPYLRIIDRSPGTRDVERDSARIF